MAVRRFVLSSAVPMTAVLIVTAGCSDSPPAAVWVDPPRASGGPMSAPPPAGGGLVKEGWFGAADGLHARIEIKGVERQPTRSVLRLTLTPLEAATPSPTAAAGTMPFAVSLLDPVNRRFYRPLTGGQPSRLTVNTPQEMTVEYPPLPPDVQRITVITPGTAGEFTGVPVTTAAASAPTSSASTSSAPTATAAAAATPGAAPTTSPTASPTASPGASQAPGGGAIDLYDITEGEVRDVVSGPAEESLSLRADALFDSDSDKPSARARQVLDQAAADIRQKADPARPIAVDGHTDSAGDASRNLDLSRRRAEAVVKELKNRLGASFTFTATGKGEADPVAKEGGSGDAAARARNRRVVISYRVRQQAPGARPPSATSTASTASATPTLSASATPTPSATPSPAEFRARDGATVASRTGRFGQAKRRLDVKPFYRDGAYLVAVFEIVNEGPGNTPPDASYAHKDYPGGAFTAFSVSAPGGKDVYRAVRIGPAAPGAYAAYVDPGRATFRTGVGQPARGFVYFPAPPGTVTKVTFDAGPFGKIDNVPVD
ncbi:UNVERIFIED_ORG: outer membrane protein OmpA-like peptidoglycan-associated protein [Actinomadura viridilutea]|nr:OmpA family protein [Actinomadura rubrobrunea]